MPSDTPTTTPGHADSLGTERRGLGSDDNGGGGALLEDHAPAAASTTQEPGQPLSDRSVKASPAGADLAPATVAEDVDGSGVPTSAELVSPEPSTTVGRAPNHGKLHLSPILPVRFVGGPWNGGTAEMVYPFPDYVDAEGGRYLLTSHHRYAWKESA